MLRCFLGHRDLLPISRTSILVPKCRAWCRPGVNLAPDSGGAVTPGDTGRNRVATVRDIGIACTPFCQEIQLTAAGRTVSKQCSVRCHGWVFLGLGVRSRLYVGLQCWVELLVCVPVLPLSCCSVCVFGVLSAVFCATCISGISGIRYGWYACTTRMHAPVVCMYYPYACATRMHISLPCCE